MATRTRFKSPSPAPTPSGSMTLDGSPAPRSPAQVAKILSKDTFPSPPTRLPSSTQRRSELPVLNYHNARPAGESAIVLPSTGNTSSFTGSGNSGQTLGDEPAANFTTIRSPPPPPTSVDESKDETHLPFGWVPASPNNISPNPAPRPAPHPIGVERRRSLSIQSLISSPPLPDADSGERGLKRKVVDDHDDDMDMMRSSRGTSVISTAGLSLEDPDVRDAVEALGGLKADFAGPPTAPHSPRNSVQQLRQEPLLNLIQQSPSVHPLLSTALSISNATYSISKSYIPPFRYVAESAENLTAPVVRRSGIEDYIRRGLTRNRSEDSVRDVEAGSSKRRRAEKPVAEKAETQIAERENTPGWQRRLYYSSTGLATALSDDSRKSLKYCLRILISANANLVKVIETLTSVLDELDRFLEQKRTAAAEGGDPESGGIAGYLPESVEQRRQRLSETVDRLKDEALKTLKQVVDTISRYAGGALPEQARSLVKRQLLSFPMRWQAAAKPTTEVAVVGDDDGAQSKGKAVRVLVMAREGLEMMRSVSEVVEGTLVSADEWCDRFRKKRPEEDSVNIPQTTDETEKGHRKTVSWIDGGRGIEKEGTAMEVDQPSK